MFLVQVNVALIVPWLNFNMGNLPILVLHINGLCKWCPRNGSSIEGFFYANFSWIVLSTDSSFASCFVLLYHQSLKIFDGKCNSSMS